jgi:signal transduction histidine kinase
VAGLLGLIDKPDGFSTADSRLAEVFAEMSAVAMLRSHTVQGFESSQSALETEVRDATTENAVLLEGARASTARMQSLSRRLVEAQESERRRIARELHDEAGQALAALRFGLRLLEREASEGGSVTARVEELVQRTDDLIDGLHRLAADLRPASLDHLGLEAALSEYSRSTGSKFGLPIRFKARGLASERLPMAVETALYRVVQEAMTNVVRHARATRVDVLVERSADRVTVMVEDDGVGFEPDRVERGTHFGLLGLRERADALGGTLTVESRPGAGTTVVVEVSSADPHPDRR